MRPVARSYPRALAPSLVAGLTVWACLLAWNPLLEDAAHVVPLLGTVVVLAVSGSIARWVGMTPPVTVALQAVVAGALFLTWTTGAPVPTPDRWAELRELVAQGMASARTYSAPVPGEVPPVWPLFLLVGTLAAILFDLVALSLRRVAAGALLLLALHLVPANLAVDVAWWVFVVVAGGFLVLLHLDTDDLVLRWGNSREVRAPGADGADLPSRAAPLPGPGTASALRIGALAVVGAMGSAALLAAVVPHSPVGPWTPGAGSSTQVSLTSPLVDMRRDLDRGVDISLLVVESDRRPTYVRHAVLPEFDGTEWSTGSRSAVPLPRDGTELTLAGVDPLVRRTERSYAFTAADAFRSRWLPLMSLTSRVEAEGDWRWDRDTTDVASFDSALTTSGESWTATGVELDYSTSLLRDAPSGVSDVPPVFSNLPDDLPDSVRRWATEVTADETTRFGQALALQNWFRSEFDYSIEQVETVDNDALVEFLSPEGRVGYCEQFAAAMAVMARTLDIPSRVAVGFLEPRRTGVREWEFSSYDLHAWPELYFPGSGWVRFEPTPASRAPGVPDYTEARPTPDAEPSAPASEETAPTTPTPTVEEPQAVPPTPDVESTDPEGVAWGSVLAWLAGGAALVVLALAPQWLRQRRRAARLAEDDAESWWAELRDSAVDLGLDWPRGHSPRATGAMVMGWVDDDRGPERAATDVTDHVERLVVAVERQRFARPGVGGDGGPTKESGATVTDVEACLDALSASANRGARWRARWVPRSLAGRLDRTTAGN